MHTLKNKNHSISFETNANRSNRTVVCGFSSSSSSLLNVKMTGSSTFFDFLVTPALARWTGILRAGALYISKETETLHEMSWFINWLISGWSQGNLLQAISLLEFLLHIFNIFFFLSLNQVQYLCSTWCCLFRLLIDLCCCRNWNTLRLFGKNSQTSDVKRNFKLRL